MGSSKGDRPVPHVVLPLASRGVEGARGRPGAGSPTTPAITDRGLEAFLREIGRMAADAVLANYCERLVPGRPTVKTRGGIDRRPATRMQQVLAGKP
jgi:hypothetical protein